MKAANVRVPHPNKALFPAAHISKQTLASYYERIAPVMLRHITDRPLTFKQHPSGIGEAGFFRKHVPKHFPAYVKRVEVPRSERALGSIVMATADEAADLKYFAGQNVIELHIATARAPRLDVPDQLVFDLDPSDAGFDKVRDAALRLKQVLDTASIPSFVKLSGRTGIHVHIPIHPTLKYSLLKPWTKRLARELVQRFPQLMTLEHLRRKRDGKVYVDVLRNDVNQTVVAPYSVRALTGAPIAIPVTWEELKQRKAHPQHIHIRNIHRRLGQKSDPWRTMMQQAVAPATLTAAL